jgi:hypothetical protein
MMPHLGVLAQVHEAAAAEVFERDCMIYLGTCVAPLNQGKAGGKCFDYELTVGGATRRGEVAAGEISLVPLALGQTGELTAHPTRHVDLGAGRGKALEATVHGGVVGLVLDGRGRPLEVPEVNRAEVVARWARALDAYPEVRE